MHLQVTHKSTFGANPDIKQDQLNAIETKLKEKETSLAAPDSFRGLKEVSRQEMDIEKSMFRGTDRDRNDLSNLLTRKKGCITGDPNDPINHLPQMMAEIEERSREKIREKRRKRRRNRRRGNNDDDLEDAAGDIGNEEVAESDDGAIGCLTFEEMTALKQSESSTQHSEEKTALDSTAFTSITRTDADCERDNNGDAVNTQFSSTNDSGCRINEEEAIESGPGPESSRKVLKGIIEFLPEEYIKENRLSMEEIKKLPKFTNYEAGSPSNVSRPLDC